ncbi:MAG: hypothetical protein JSW11_21750 [Candidatus Heimdallarchaeota archaeon]|nr:MAG: hypothetical protein JSW11_21750 [Candidatus Heimdallarchaeota archaeon]
MKLLKLKQYLFLYSVTLIVGFAFIVEISKSQINCETDINPQYKLKSDILADKIFLSTNTITDWTSDMNVFARGIVLGKVNVSDLTKILTKYQSNNDWQGIIYTKRYSELLNYSPLMIDEVVKWALNQTPMFENYSLPVTQSDHYFNMWRQYTLYGYRYAKELNYLTEKWNATSAFEGLRNCRITNSRAFYECNPDTNSTKDLFNTRWMSTANLANCFTILFNETSLEEALEYAFQEWLDLNTYYWNEHKNGYDYARSWKTWEWDAIEVFFNFDKLRRLNGTLQNWDRVYIDLQNRYLVNSWDSHQWRANVVVHSKGSNRRELFGTLDAWMLLHTYFAHFNKTNKLHMQRMLEGEKVIQAWQALLRPEAGLYDSETFRFTLAAEKPVYTDYATTEGCMTLFLMGISPQDGGGLLIPKRCNAFSGEPFPADVFRFYYHNRQIIIPIGAKTTLKFLYGSEYPIHYFAEGGLYRITFSSDWNSIIQVEQIEEILSGIPREPTLTSSSTTEISLIGFQIGLILLIYYKLWIKKKSLIL